MKTSLDSRSQQFLADLNRLDERQAKVQRAISSGYRINQPSDAPEQVIDILQLRSDIERAESIEITLARVSAEVNTAEAAVQVAVQLVERARTLAAQAATGTATNRPSVASEVRELHQQLVDITRTLSEGRYVFGGDNDGVVPYSADWSQPGGIAPPATTANTRRIQDVNGTSFAVARTAGQLFDTRNADNSFADDNVFNALYSLVNALEADDQAAVQTAGVKIASSLDHLGRELSFYGQAQNRIARATDLTRAAVLARNEELTLRQDTDMAEAIIELSTVKVHREAALGAQAQQPRSSLFSYLA